MRAVGKGLALVVALAGFVAGGALGGCAMIGLTASIWSPAVLNTALGNPPDRSHPAFWFFLAGLPPAMLLGFLGAFFGWVVPVCYLTGARLGHAAPPRWCRRYLYWVRVVLDPRRDPSAGPGSRLARNCT
jgi:hypothetical protein